MRTHTFLYLAVVVAFLLSCEQKKLLTFTPDHEEIRYSGRIDLSNQWEPVLAGSASSVEMVFEGDSCQIFVRKMNPGGEQNYISIELDGDDKGRTRLESDSAEAITIHAESQAESHHLKIFKATESANNYVAFEGIKCEGLGKLPPLPDRKIEFIGNSITCGMGNDLTDIPCDAGTWYDQHNAYWAYGPIAARELDARFMLSSVSGIGIYRNWNSPGPVMPDVYENLFLNTDDSRKWDFDSFVPDLVSICLGTNDMSEGDGSNDRQPFDSARYVGEYIAFVTLINKKYPDAQICLLNSPMVRDEKGVLLINCLKAVSDHINEALPEVKPIKVLEFPAGIEPHGCAYHPPGCGRSQADGGCFGTFLQRNYGLVIYLFISKRFGGILP
jgi:hypothetical protein